MKLKKKNYRFPHGEALGRVGGKLPLDLPVGLELEGDLWTSVGAHHGGEGGPRAELHWKKKPSVIVSH